MWLLQFILLLVWAFYSAACKACDEIFLIPIYYSFYLSADYLVVQNRHFEHKPNDVPSKCK